MVNINPISHLSTVIVQWPEEQVIQWDIKCSLSSFHVCLLWAKYQGRGGGWPYLDLVTIVNSTPDGDGEARI